MLRPDDCRRMFASEQLNTSTPPHGIQALLGIPTGVHAPGHGCQNPGGVLAAADLPVKPIAGVDLSRAMPSGTGRR